MTTGRASSAQNKDFISRMVGAARLDQATYNEVEHDTTALPQAALVVVLVALASTVAVLNQGVGTIIAAPIVAIINWGVWAFITYWIGTRLLPTPQTHADWGQMLRTTGFAQSPGILRVGGIIPGVGPLIVFVALVWQLVAMVVAVQHALDYTSVWRAVGVVAIAFVINLIVTALFYLVFGGI